MWWSPVHVHPTHQLVLLRSTYDLKCMKEGVLIGCVMTGCVLIGYVMIGYVMIGCVMIGCVSSERPVVGQRRQRAVGEGV